MTKDRIETYLKKKYAIDLLECGEYMDEDSITGAKFKLLEDLLYELKMDLKEEKPKAEKPNFKPIDEFKQKPKNPKNCVRCGKEFLPNSGRQIYCESCKKVVNDITKTARELAEG